MASEEGGRGFTCLRRSLAASIQPWSMLMVRENDAEGPGVVGYSMREALNFRNWEIITTKKENKESSTSQDETNG